MSTAKEHGEKSWNDFEVFKNFVKISSHVWTIAQLYGIVCDVIFLFFFLVFFLNPFHVVNAAVAVDAALLQHDFFQHFVGEKRGGKRST